MSEETEMRQKILDFLDLQKKPVRIDLIKKHLKLNETHFGATLNNALKSKKILIKTDCSSGQPTRYFSIKK